jgi:hypothetical protein
MDWSVSPERRNLVSARVPSHFNWSLPPRHLPRQSKENHIKPWSGQSPSRSGTELGTFLIPVVFLPKSTSSVKTFQYCFYLRQLAWLSHSSRASAPVSSLGSRIPVDLLPQSARSVLPIPVSAPVSSLCVPNTYSSPYISPSQKLSFTVRSASSSHLLIDIEVTYR